LLGAWRFFLLKAIDNADGEYPTISRLKIQSAVSSAQYRVRNLLANFLCNDLNFPLSVHCHLQEKGPSFLARLAGVCVCWA